MTEMRAIQAGWAEKWPAPAKLNLMLRITGRRADGYHSLQTVFQMLELCDWLKFSPMDADVVRLSNPIPGVPEETDLTVRAAKLLKEYSGCRLGVSIEIEKNLPMGGGLGGGSSDAATTLVVLNRLWGLDLSVEELMNLGLRLGADVPVFVFGHSAWAEGVGEELQSVTLPEKWVVILKPDCHVNTKEIFCAKELTRDSKAIKMSDFLAGESRNDCTLVVSKLYQPVADALDALSVYAESRLTGTGACVFALFESEEGASYAAQALAGDWLVFVTRAVNSSLLSKKMEQV